MLKIILFKLKMRQEVLNFATFNLIVSKMSEDGMMEFMSTTRSFQDSSDILIYTNDNQSFIAPRLMLVYSSPFFYALLNGPFVKEKILRRQQTSTIYMDMTQD